MAQAISPDRNLEPPSVLFDAPASSAGVDSTAPAHFTDLNLDQVVHAIVVGREDYDLLPFFYSPLPTVESVAYRHEVFRDLERPELVDAITSFAQKMRSVRSGLDTVGQLHYERQRQAWHLDAVLTYAEAVIDLSDALGAADLRSRGLSRVRAYLRAYAESERFGTLINRAHELRADLNEITYCLHITANRVTASRYEGQPDYSREVLDTFQKFASHRSTDCRAKLASARDMNHVEAEVLDLVARLHPDVFAELERYRHDHAEFVDPGLARFDREIQFSIAILEHAARLARAGQQMCLPQVSESKRESVTNAFDLALAGELITTPGAVVTNDFRLIGEERVLVITGPNQGGKTTFARMFGQIHHLASIGALVPAGHAEVHLSDQIFTHFEREERHTTLSGKLEDELLRVRDILDRATTQSIVIMNESFSSTTAEDSSFLGHEILERIVAEDVICVYVTFIDELSELGEATVSMVSTVDPDDPALRTFKVVRRPADGLAYAAALAQNHGLTYSRIKARMSR